jgi:peroxiredoxin
MSQRKARATRQVETPAQAAAPFWTPVKALLVAAAVVAVVGASFVVPKLTGGSTSAGHDSMAAAGDGPAIGSAPSFAEKNALTSSLISSRTLRGHKTLLFFSEGVMCQACLEQIADIDYVGDALARRGIDLVSITPDSTAELRQAIDQYGISSPMISDGDRNMSRAFDMLGRGMHADVPGHAFVLIDGAGRVLWQRDYYQPPYRTMYVEPRRLFDDLPA